jgi:transcriptional regulator with XRE-family HTH domain
MWYKKVHGCFSHHTMSKSQPVGVNSMEMETFGNFLRDRREQRRLGLRQFCSELNFDPSRWSKVERGVLQPPSDEGTLRDIAKLLGIKQDGGDWNKLKDLAAFGRGEIPKDIMADEELVACLPLVFRTLRNEKPTREQLYNLADLIRHSDKDGKRDEET